MREFRFILTLIVIFYSAALAQPRQDWVQMYGDEPRDYFYDVFLPADGGYAMCGQDRIEGVSHPWIVVTNEAGEETFNRTYDIHGNGGRLYTIIEVEGGGFLAGGYLGNPRKFWVLRVDGDGDIIFDREYSVGASTGNCQAVIEMKDGSFILAGRNNRQGYLVSINDEEGDVNWEEYYRNVGADMDVHTFYAMRQTRNGILVAGGTNSGVALLVNVTNEGEIIWSQPYYPPDGDGNQVNFRSIISYRDGFAMVGENFTRIANEWASWYWFVHIAENGEIIWNRSFNIGALLGSQIKILYSIAALPDGGLVGVGNGHPRINDGIIIKINKIGELQWFQTYPFLPGDREGFYAKTFYSALSHPEGGVIAVGQGKGRDSGGDVEPGGFLLKLVPERSAPIILSYIPDKIELSVLIGDTVLFAVEAVDQQDDSLSYVWTVGEDTVSVRESTIVQFDELRDWNVSCVVSDGRQASSLTWLVHVEEWYIDSYTPDSLAWTVRRPREVDFSLGVRAIEGIEPDYHWILTNRVNQLEGLGEEADISYNFDLRGDYRLLGRVYDEDVERTVSWQVTVNSVLWWWSPQEREFETPINEPVEFSVIPINWDSDSLEFFWYVDDHAESIGEGIIYTFNDVGEHTVVAIVHDGVEEDRVVWTIMAYDPESVGDDPASMLPTEVTLYPATPNPFNATTTIRYFLPRSADVRLTVYDSRGRLVETLSAGWRISGKQTTMIQGTDLAAGVYLLRLEAGGVFQLQKVVLLK